MALDGRVESRHADGKIEGRKPSVVACARLFVGETRGPILSLSGFCLVCRSQDHTIKVWLCTLKSERFQSGSTVAETEGCTEVMVTIQTAPVDHVPGRHLIAQKA